MDRALLLPQCIQLVVGRAAGPIFLGWALPIKSKLSSSQALKLDRVQALGYYKIKNERKTC